MYVLHKTVLMIDFQDNYFVISISSRSITIQKLTQSRQINNQQQLMNREQQKQRELQDYKIVKQIGSGTFGKVYLARNKFDVAVAIKNVLQDKKYKNRELQITRQLNHSNIVRLEHYFYQKQNNDYLNLVLEYVPDTLSRLIKNNKKESKFIPNETIRVYTYQIFKALAYLNKVNVCHRDIKPPNILIGEKNQLKLCDFGSAKSLVEGQKNIAYICSRYYRAPELIFGSINYTNKIDVWSAGCVIAEMATNRVFFEGENSTDQLFRIIRILGSPTYEDIYSMGVTELKFEVPKIKPIQLNKYFLKYNPNLDTQLIAFMSRILVYNPTKRLSAEEALMDPYLRPYQDKEQGTNNLSTSSSMKDSKEFSVKDLANSLFGLGKNEKKQ